MRVQMNIPKNINTRDLDNQHLGSLVNIYNLGAAHGHPRFDNVLDFGMGLGKKMIDSKGKIFLCICNSRQDVEKNFLRELHFDEHVVNGPSQLCRYLITKDDFFSKNEFIQKEFKARLQAEKEAEEKLARDKAEFMEKNKGTQFEGRAVNNDGSIRRRPFEFFINDRIRFRENWNVREMKEGNVYGVTDNETPNVSLRLRTRSIQPAKLYSYELVNRAH